MGSDTAETAREERSFILRVEQMVLQRRVCTEEPIDLFTIKVSSNLGCTRDERM